MNGFKQTEIGLIPEDWEVVRLGEVLTEVDIRVKDLKNINFSNLDVYSLTKEYGLIPQNKRFKKRIAIVDISNYKVVRKWQIVYNPYVIWEGAIYALRNEEIVAVSPVYCVWECKYSNPSFIDRLLRTKKLLNEYLSRASGVVNRRRSVSKEDFLNIKIPLPPLSEQQKIAKVLDKIQQAIEIQDRIIEETKNLKKSLMQKLFTEGLYGEEQKETEIGLIPKSWEVVRFENAILKEKIKVGKIKQQEYENFGKYPIVDQSQNYIAGFSNDEKKVYKGPLPVIIFGDHTRIFKFVDFPFIVGADGVKILIPNQKIYDPLFLFFALLNLDIPNRGYNRHYSILKEKKLPLPPLKEQKEIAHILSTVDKKIEIEQKKKELLKELFKTMLHKLMSGEIRLKDVEL